MSNPIIRLDKVQSVYVGNIESVQYDDADLPQGSAVNLGALVTGSREIYTAGQPATATLGTAEVLLVASPEVMYEAGKALGDFTNKAKKPCRAYHLTEGDVFTITDDGLDGTTAVDKYLVPKNGQFKLAVAADLSGNTKFAAIIIEKGTLGYAGSAATTARVIKV
jgi:hypothetical protein